MSSLATLDERPTAEVWAFPDDDLDERPFVKRPRTEDLAPASQQHELEARFHVLADELEDAVAGMSSTTRAVGLPAYVGILALGSTAIPFLLRRLETTGRRPIFLRLLGSLTAFQPGAGHETVEEAAAEWVRWGRREGRFD